MSTAFRYISVPTGVCGVLIAAVVLTAGLALAQPGPQDSLVDQLRRGGLVLVMRHASSPREVPTTATAKPDNTKLERQLDEAGRRGATAMGTALRQLRIPIGEVFTSPTRGCCPGANRAVG